MAIECWRPFGTLMDRGPFQEIQSEMNRLFDTFPGRAAPLPGAGRAWGLGVPEKEISLSITGDVLTLKGERRGNERLNGDSYFHGERTFGRFERSIRLPVPVEAEGVKATYRDGVLEVRLPKAESSRPKEIKIEVL